MSTLTGSKPTTRKTVDKTKELTVSKKTFNITKTAEPVTFAVDDDDFEAIAADRLPAGSLATYFQSITAGDLFGAQDQFFQAVLTEESYKLFSDRLNSKEKPITIGLLGDIAAWLLGDVYMGGNPTEEDKQ